MHTAFSICAPTPAPPALTIKIAVRLAIVIVVTPSTLQKTARSPGENNRSTLTTIVKRSPDEHCDRSLPVHVVWPGAGTDGGTLYTGS